MNMNINKEIHLFLQQLPNCTNKKIAVGYSAGADSTVLLDVLNKKSKYFNFQLEAVFFSHNGSPIGEGEDKNLILARKFCKELKVNLIEVELNLIKQSKKSWEQLGRMGRLNFYKKSNYDMVFLGHHQDDQNETTMIQIFRGGGRGSSAMKSIDGIFYRPMLGIRKNDIYAYLKEKNIDWIEDPTNENTDFTRNFWRKIGLPKIEKYYPNYSNLLETFRHKNNYLNNLAVDMAKIDGLDSILIGKSINIKDLKDYRIINLLNNVFSVVGNSLENNKIENFLKIGRSTKNAEINIGNYILYYRDDNIGLIENKKILIEKSKFKF